MPRCEGLPDGPCPSRKNDDTEKLGEGDLMSCKSCDKAWFKQFNSRSAASVGSNPGKHIVVNDAPLRPVSLNMATVSGEYMPHCH